MLTLILTLLIITLTLYLANVMLDQLENSRHKDLQKGGRREEPLGGKRGEVVA